MPSGTVQVKKKEFKCIFVIQFEWVSSSQNFMYVLINNARKVITFCSFMYALRICFHIALATLTSNQLYAVNGKFIMTVIQCLKNSQKLSISEHKNSHTCLHGSNFSLVNTLMTSVDFRKEIKPQ